MVSVTALKREGGSKRRARQIHPSGLTAQQVSFAEAFIANNGNATSAYRSVHPGCTLQSAAVLGHRWLSSVKVRRYLNERLQPLWRAQAMSADEAIAHLSAIAKFDIRDLFGEDGEPLKPHEWPDSIKGCVKGISQSRQGLRLLLESPVLALQTLLEIADKLRGPSEGLDALANALKADIQRQQTGAASVTVVARDRHASS